MGRADQRRRRWTTRVLVSLTSHARPRTLHPAPVLPPNPNAGLKRQLSACKVATKSGQTTLVFMAGQNSWSKATTRNEDGSLDAVDSWGARRSAEQAPPPHAPAHCSGRRRALIARQGPLRKLCLASGKSAGNPDGDLRSEGGRAGDAVRKHARGLARRRERNGTCAQKSCCPRVRPVAPWGGSARSHALQHVLAPPLRPRCPNYSSKQRGDCL
jgi:hypothetical protein